MPRRFITPALTFDRAAILRAAWIKARALVVTSARPCFPFPARPISLRAAFAEALRDTWDIAKAERGYAVWCAEQDANAAAEAERRAAMSAHDAAVEAARAALLLAEHNDTIGGHRIVAEARARLASLQHAA